MLEEQSPKTETIIQLENIKKSYITPSEELSVLANLNLTVKRGDIISIMGPSGSGKTTLLNILGLLDEFDEGIFRLAGIDIKDVPPKKKNKIRLQKIGFIFQTFNLIQTLTAQQNVELPMALLKIPEKEQNTKSKELLNQLGIGTKLKKYQHELSIGEQQRVAIARALANDPVILLADEPTGNLDEDNTRKFLDFMKSVLDKMDLTLIIVSHNPILKEICNKSYLLRSGKLEDESSNLR